MRHYAALLIFVIASLHESVAAETTMGQFGGQVSEAIQRGDEIALLGLTVDKEEFLRHIWPKAIELNISKNLGPDDAWERLRVMSAHGARALCLKLKGSEPKFAKMTYVGHEKQTGMHIFHRPTLHFVTFEGESVSVGPLPSLLYVNGSYRFLALPPSAQVVVN